MPLHSANTFRAAGLATLSRQIICKSLVHAPVAKGGPLGIAAMIILKSTAHKVSYIVIILDSLISLTVVLVEQAAFPLFLQVFNRFYGAMEKQIELEEIQLGLIRKPQIAYLLVSPLHFLILGDYCDSFQSHIDANKAIVFSPFESTMATVTKVIDGDSIRTDASDKIIRIKKLACPELNEKIGEIARDYAVKRLLHKQVKLIADHHCDMYSRILADVEIDGKDFAEEMIALDLCKRWVEYSEF